jgi:hypothetical protein
MYFKSEKAREYLVNHGMVYTIRRHRYHVGKDYMSLGRGKPKIADIYIEEVGPMFDGIDTLKAYVDQSGFETPGDWLSELFSLHRSDSQRPFYMYRVRLIR